jgi:hypothetical protein
MIYEKQYEKLESMIYHMIEAREPLFSFQAQSDWRWLGRVFAMSLSEAGRASKFCMCEGLPTAGAEPIWMWFEIKERPV